MKARKKFDFGLKDFRLWMITAMSLFYLQSIASQSFIEGKNLFQIQKNLNWREIQSSLNAFVSPHPIQPALMRRSGLSSCVFLPRWSEERLPIFCRIEHNMIKSNVIPIKFRLGSVEYVDWLEGKN